MALTAAASASGFLACASTLAGRAVSPVSAKMVELQEQVLPQFVARQFALLVLNAADLSVLHQLSVESDQFHRDTLNRIGMAQSLRPRIDVLDATFERRRQPAFGPPPIVEAGPAVAGLSTAATAPDGPARVETLLDLRSAVSDFAGEDDFACLLVDDRDARHSRAGVDLELEIGRLRVEDLALQDDGERSATKHGGFTAR